ncbi:MAG TPA: hypothetical protein VK867_04195 [Candidatus Limnocylindrales bacterium]|nr:hypothetical protein [Candidatus Limnocylindrales bacterium]
MRRARALTLIAVASLTTAVGACEARTSNPDGWWDPGVHVVDGYRVKNEVPCAGLEGGCSHAVDAAVKKLREQGFDLPPTAAWRAEIPVMRGKTDNDLVFAGFAQPTFLILHFRDGTRRTIPLVCGVIRHTSTEAIEGCLPTDLDMFRVGNGWMADR